LEEPKISKRISFKNESSSIKSGKIRSRKSGQKVLIILALTLSNERKSLPIISSFFFNLKN
jgi:hypothetical protein